MRKYQTIEHKEDTELMNEANLDLWIAIREEKKYWRKKFHVVTINSHEVCMHRCSMQERNRICT
jgi:hypothetical protein